MKARRIHELLNTLNKLNYKTNPLFYIHQVYTHYTQTLLSSSP